MSLKDLSLKSCAAGLCAAVMVAAFSVRHADAGTKKEQRYYAQQQRYDAQPRSQGQYSGGTLSLDGRNTGQPRTCGYDYFQYDHRGATMGPYCH